MCVCLTTGSAASETSEMTGHAQVHHQLVAAVQPQQDEFASAIDAADALTDEQAAKDVRRADAQHVGAEHIHGLEPASQHRAAQVAGDGLHLGKLRHSVPRDRRHVPPVVADLDVNIERHLELVGGAHR